jgi:prefoldin subunit 5
MPGKIHVPVTVATNGFDKLQRTFGRLKGVALGVTAALGGLAVVSRSIDFTGAAVQGARDLERNYAGLESVFKDNTEQMKEFGKAASDLGLSMSEAAKSTTFIGSVLKQSGFALQETSDLTEELVSLGADLALTFGYDIQESLLAMTALFRGEYDPIEKFGVAMKQSEIDAEKLARGLDHLTGAEERFADQQIRVEFLMERAADATGAVERQSGNLTVQQMRLRAEFENVRDTVAADLLPAIADFTGGLREIVDDVGPKLENSFEDLAPVLDRMGTQLLPVIEGAIDGVIAGFDIVIGVLDRATDPTSELNESLSDLGDSLANLFSGVDTEQGDQVASTIDAIAGSIKFLADQIKRIVDFVNGNPWLLDLLGIAVGARLIGKGAGGKKASGGSDSNAKELAATAGGIAAIALAAKALPKPILGVGIIAYILGENIYGPLKDGNEGLIEASQSFDIATGSVEDFQRAFAASAAIKNNPYGTVANFIDEAKDFQVEFNDALEESGLKQVAFNSELSDGSKLAEALGMQDGLPTWYNTVAQAAGEATTAALGFKDASIQVLELELLDLSRFARFAPDGLDDEIEKTRAALIELKKERGDYLTGDDDGDGDGASGEAKDYVAEFFDGIKEGIRKEAAKLDLEELGLSAALIDQILGSQGWEELFQTIVDGGADLANQLQDDFNQTEAGIAEIAEAAEALAEELEELREQQEKLQTQITETQQDQRDALKEATDTFYEYKEGINNTVDALDTYERSIGRFESQTRSDLERITSQINDAFDNDYLLMEARDNLLEYARAELNVLMQLQRQRDDLLAQRNAAADTIFGIAKAVTSAGDITGLLRDVQDEVKEVEVKELFEDVVKSADGLNGFKVTLERNYTDVITNTVSKSKALVNGFQDVIDRTRDFIDNLKILREMGLDPFLFNQLVDAGAEAGGATAAALVEGGKDTVNEVNSLQGELEAMGVELGEETYQVTKNSGEQFVSGIVDGIDAELASLGEMAQTMATDFTTTFEILFKAGMESAFDGIIEGIRSEYQALIDELERELQAIQDRIARAEQQADDAAQDARVATGESIIVEGVEVQEGSSSIGPDNIGDLPASEQAFIRDAFPELFPGGGGSSQTVNVYNVNASNPLDAYNASKGNVEQQGTFQSANGNITTTLSGVGS